MNVTLRVQRQASAAAVPRLETFVVACTPQATLLECLHIVVEEHDSTLGVRDNCFAGVCGECGVRANGAEVLACRARVDAIWAAAASDLVVEVQPLRFHTLIRDLVVDRGSYFDQLVDVGALFAPHDQPSPVSVAELASIRHVTRCLHCGLCVSACDAYLDRLEFVGPAALAWTKRFLDDPRDGGAERRSKIRTAAGTAGCLDCGQCNPVCPEGVAPFDLIRRLRALP